ncbi:MAG TPA: hypothetical protein PLT64_04610 [Syntrophales bacterium]|nr:hypothetical protein [Syntrophales bacterium]HOL59134.1 hypothetical protein [Syntrophales bacterium]HPO36079.1 hypothetical protein [Syntrophales bacterium]
MVEIKRVEGREMLQEFIYFPWKSGIYKNDPAWVPPLIRDVKAMLDRKRGYFFEIGEAEYFLAFKDGRVVGRITAQVNHLYEEKYDRETGFFGFYESINDLEVARALFDAAADWLKKKGKTRLNGPQSFSIYDSVGFEVAGFDVMPSVGLFHFAPYYRELAEKCGFSKCIDWHCFVVKKENFATYAPYLSEVKAELLRKTEYQFVTLRKGEIDRRVKEIQHIFNVAWDGNWGHLPLTDKQIQMIAQDLKMIAIPELAIFAEKDGETVGFVISLPDVNPALKCLNGRLYPWRILKFLWEMRKIKRVRTIIMGVLPEHQGRHIDDIFYLRTIEDGIRLGYTESDCSLIVETNRAMIRALKPLAAQPYKTYRIYERLIN